VGLLVDRLAVALERLRGLQLRQLRRGNATIAAGIQQELIAPLQSKLLALDGTSADREAARVEAALEAAEKSPAKNPGRVVWTCCHPPRRFVSRRGETVWVADCRWRKGKLEGQTTRVIETSGTRVIETSGANKPRVAKIGGRKIKRCKCK